jgi:hypothetical protein
LGPVERANSAGELRAGRPRPLAATIRPKLASARAASAHCLPVRLLRAAGRPIWAIWRVGRYAIILPANRPPRSGGQLDRVVVRVEPLMSNRELREWLGITFADLLVYLAAIAIIAMFLVKNSTLDMVFAGAAVALTIAACVRGMKRDPELSNLTNALKLVSYPIGVVFAVVAIVVHYAWFNQ